MWRWSAGGDSSITRNFVYSKKVGTEENLSVMWIGYYFEENVLNNPNKFTKVSIFLCPQVKYYNIYITSFYYIYTFYLWRPSDWQTNLKTKIFAYLFFFCLDWTFQRWKKWYTFKLEMHDKLLCFQVSEIFLWIGKSKATYTLSVIES